MARPIRTRLCTTAGEWSETFLRRAVAGLALVGAPDPKRLAANYV